MLNPKKIKLIVAIDTSPFSIAVLDEAVLYAKSIDASLKVVLVEDINMLNAAQSPLVRSVNLFSFSKDEISYKEVQDIFAIQKTTAKKAINFAQDKHNIKIKLDVRQGKVLAEILDSAKDSDALIIGLAGWRFAKYYYSTHMQDQKSRFKFPEDGHINTGQVAKQLLQKYSGTIFALRSNIFHNSRIMIYYNGSKESKSALINMLNHINNSKNKANRNISVLLTNKELRNEVFMLISKKENILSSFYTIPEDSLSGTLQFIERLIENTKSNLLVLPSSCTLVKEKSFYEELDTLNTSLAIMR